MIHSANTIGVPSPPPQLVPPSSASNETTSFKDLLLDSIQQVNSMQLEANRAVENLVAGGEVNPAEVLTAVQKADLAFRMMMQVRNKLVQAYQEIKEVRI